MQVQGLDVRRSERPLSARHILFIGFNTDLEPCTLQVPPHVTLSATPWSRLGRRLPSISPSAIRRRGRGEQAYTLTLGPALCRCLLVRCFPPHPGSSRGIGTPEYLHGPHPSLNLPTQSLGLSSRFLRSNRLDQNMYQKMLLKLNVLRNQFSLEPEKHVFMSFNPINKSQVKCMK